MTDVTDDITMVEANRQVHDSQPKDGRVNSVTDEWRMLEYNYDEYKNERANNLFVCLFAFGF